MHLMTRVVFMGSPEFAVPTLRALAGRYEMRGVVTQPDRQAGRGRELRAPAVKSAAIELGIPVVQPPRLRETEAMQALRDWAPDVVIVAAFGQILRPEVLNLPSHGCLNVHASLLPRWRGAAPIQAAILAGDAETGITIMKMDEGLDTGGILAQARVAITPAETAASLSDKLAHLAPDLLMEALPGYLEGKLRPIPQDASKATKAPLLKKEDGLLDLNRPAEELERRVRAMNPWPGAFILWEEQRLRILKAHVVDEAARPGEHVIHEKGMAVGTGGGLLALDEVQLEGRKAMPSEQFLAGARNWVP